MAPARSGSLLSYLLTLSRTEFLRPRLPALEPAEPPQRHRRGVLLPLWLGLRRRLPGRLVRDRFGELVQVAWPLGLA